MRPVFRALRRAAVSFWYFMVGDSPEFLAAVLVVVGFALVVHRTQLAIVFGLPVMVAVVLATSVRRGQVSSRRKP